MTTSQTLTQAHWDYSLHAAYYEFRPNYASKAMDALDAYVNPERRNLAVVDIGAGTGNLSLLLAAQGHHVTAVEPNDAMRTLGEERTQGVQWVKAGGTDTSLPTGAFDWVTFGSSFNVVDREEALLETARLLKPNGYFSCLWNHRNLNDPIQNLAESIVVEFVPDYDRGVRREDQRPILEASPLFKNIFYLEVDFEVARTREEYLNAWRSVKNRFWDLATAEGQALFAALQSEMTRRLPETFTIQYTTRAWTAQKTS